MGEDAEHSADEFVGEPSMPLTDEDVELARFDALDQACRFIRDEQMKYAAPARDDSPDRGVREEAPPAEEPEQPD